MYIIWNTEGFYLPVSFVAFFCTHHCKPKVTFYWAVFRCFQNWNKYVIQISLILLGIGNSIYVQIALILLDIGDLRFPWWCWNMFWASWGVMEGQNGRLEGHMTFELNSPSQPVANSIYLDKCSFLIWKTYKPTFQGSYEY